MIIPNSFNLYLIRHGQSEGNINGHIIGQSAISKLTELGKMQATLLRRRFEKEQLVFDYAFSSHFTRAIETANIVINSKTPIVEATELREYSSGDFRGLIRTEVYDDKVKLRMKDLGNAFLPPGGESMNQTERRASQWLEDNIIYNKEVIDQSVVLGRPVNIAVFSHSMTIRCLLHYILGFDQGMMWKIDVENTAICQFQFRDNGWKLITVNDHCHLK